MEGNRDLASSEQELLRAHYPVMMTPERYPLSLVVDIYTRRRAPAVAFVLDWIQKRGTAPTIFDAGTGFGSESFLLAAMGARVLAVDLSAEQVAIAEKRQRYWEKHFGRDLEIRFEAADLNSYTPSESDLALTWIASVLAAVPDQDAFLARVSDTTQPGGEVMITDMNLLNPLFLWKEWRRRRGGARQSRDFAETKDFRGMFLRRGRRGARYFDTTDGEAFDDAQFFWWRTLGALFRSTGFEPHTLEYSGFVPPLAGAPDLSFLEGVLCRIPIVRSGAYFYRMSAVKTESSG